MKYIPTNLSFPISYFIFYNIKLNFTFLIKRHTKNVKNKSVVNMNVNSVSTTNNNTHNELLHESLELEEAERDKICHATITLQKQINNVEQEIESLSNLMIDQESLHKTKLSKLLFGYFPSHPTNYSQLLGPVRVQETETTVGDYDIGPLIGDGNYAKVHIGHHRITKQEYALKIIPKRQLNDLRILQNLEAELHILQFVDHPNLVSFTTQLGCNQIFAS